MIDAYLRELARALQLRGGPRRRFLAESREHLIDLAAAMGDARAVASFGPARELAAAFDAEVATRRSVVATWWTAAGVTATGLSTLTLIHAADPAAQAPRTWAILFLGSAQVAMVCVALAVVQALRLRCSPNVASDITLLCRRGAIALVSAAVTMFSAGAALPGSGSAVALLAGPLIAVAGAVALLRAWLLTRRLEGAHERVDRSPFADARALTGLPLPVVGPLPIALAAALAAFLRDQGERGASTTGSLGVAAIEAALVLSAYVALRRPLGLRAPHA